jgi:hypothetical protein
MLILTLTLLLININIKFVNVINTFKKSLTVVYILNTKYIGLVGTTLQQV